MIDLLTLRGRVKAYCDKKNSHLNKVATIE